MLKTDGFGVQHESLCRFIAIKRIAHDGGMEPLAVGTVHAQLMCTACLGPEGEAQVCVVDAGEYPIFGDCLLAMLMTHYLAWTVHVVGHQRQTDGSFLRHAVGCCLVLATHDGDIPLLHLSGCKLLLQTMIGKLGLGNHHQSAGRHVEPMNDERSCGLGHSAPHDGIHRLGSVLSWNRQHSCRLAYYGYLLIFVDSLQLRLVFFRPRTGGLGQHPLQDGLALAVAGRIEVQVVAYFLLRTFSPPEHGHLQRTITVAVGILQQLGLAAFSAASRWNLGCRVLENLQEILAIALWVEHTELAKQPSLQ